MKNSMIKKIVFITNEPAPYRVPIFEKISATSGFSFHVIFCCRREPNRHWSLPPVTFEHTFLRERIRTVNGRYIHNNPDVIPTLRRIAPDVVITDGFNPTHLYAFGYALLKGLPHIPMTDGTLESEKALSPVHRLVRRFVYYRSRAFLWASLGGKKLYESYGIQADRTFQSCLCIDNSVYLQEPPQETAEKCFDFIFCGRMEPAKSPLFALQVALQVARRLQRKVSILFVGTGSQEEEIRQAAALHPDLLQAAFNGHAVQHELPALYRSARVFLFPTIADVWGVVANEACAAGLPVLVSPHAGVAGELVLDGENGYVCALDADVWAERAARLLTEPDLYRKFSECSRAIVDKYTYKEASSGIVTACHIATLDSAALG